jgi:hypothetical protein
VSNLIVDRLRDTPCEISHARIACVMLLVSTAVAVACTVLPTLSQDFMTDFAHKMSGSIFADFSAKVCPLILLCASALIFFRPRLGYGLGLLGGLLLLPWFVWTESALWEGSWPVLNSVGATPSDRQLSLYVKFRLASALLMSITAACCILRSFPSRWAFRGSPVRRRTWPSFVFGFAIVVLWFHHSAQPYRVPIIVDGPRSLVRVLHVEKRGLQFRETGMSTSRDHRFIRWRDDRHLFQYRFDRRMDWGVLDNALFERMNSLLTSEALRMRRTPPAKPLLSWNAEGWYIVLRDERLLAFTGEDRLVPPHEIIDLLHDIEDVSMQASGHGPVQDICFDFCYGPVAALGFVFPNQPCFKLTEGTTECR